MQGLLGKPRIPSSPEVSIASGGLTVTRTLTDTNGPQASVATANGKFLYTGNSNGSISEYKIGGTGTLPKIAGSPIKRLTNPTGLVSRPFYNWFYATDPTANVIDVYNLNPTTGVLTLSSSETTDGNGPQAVAVDPFGQFTLVVNTTSDQVAIGVPNVGWVGTIATA